MRNLIYLTICLLTTLHLTAQTSAADRQQGMQKRNNLQKASLVQNVPFRNIGPTIMSGRVTDVDVNPDNTTEFYVAYASGGLWYTDNNGQSLTPVFDHEEVMTIGDIAVDWKKNIVIVGTGEVNSSRSSYAGNGIYRSDDKGAHWQYLGLPESHHIGRIVLDPQNSDIMYVAVLGHLYTANKERGIYKTTDGGKTWKQTLFVNENTGAVDLVMDPQHANILYAATWQRDRKAWNFTGNGAGSGIYRSDDNGNNWKLMTTPGAGFPTGDGVGRIGLAVSYQHPDMIYAILDNQFRTPDTSKTDTSVIALKDLKNINKEDFLLLDERKLNAFLKDNYFPENITATALKDSVRKGSYKASVITDYLNIGDYDFSTPVIGAEVYKSSDGGKTWNRTHEEKLNGLFFTYGYYFANIRVDPQNDNNIYVLGFVALKSEDGGKTFKDITKPNVHPDHHALWIDAKDSGHLINGNDGGINITYDDGLSWINANSPAVGQFYSVTVDDAKPYNVYGGLQDNGVWRGPSSYGPSNEWMSSGAYPYKNIYGGDGMQVQVDTRDNNTVYTGYQFGFYGRENVASGSEEISIRPGNVVGQTSLRFNWQTPILLSKHNQDILYYGTNRFHRSLNKGENLEQLSIDLTTGGIKGNVPYGTITTLSESPLKFGLLYCGTDDGNIWISKDGGYTWNKIINKLPQALWVSRVIAGKFDEGTVYASLSGYRNDDFSAYLYMSRDFGATWMQIGKGLPSEPLNVVREDPKDKKIIYAGTDNGLYVSLNNGLDFMAFGNSLPAVAVHDIAIQERENDIVVGTHGRSIYIASLNEVQALDTIMQKDIFIYPVTEITYDAEWGNKYAVYADANTARITIPYFVQHAGIMQISVQDTAGLVLATLTDTAEAGINYPDYDLHADAAAIASLLNKTTKPESKYTWHQGDNKQYYLLPGKYTLVFSGSGLHAEKEISVVVPERRSHDNIPEPSEENEIK